MNKKILLIVLLSVLLISGCINKSNNKANKAIDIKESDDVVSTVKVIINNNSYILNLENNETVSEFIKLLPEEYNMSELNGNEKYAYLDTSLPTNSSIPERINKGDVMLYGNNCLVVFYESFNTNYSYTKIGHIDNLPDLGKKNITIKFQK